MPGSQTKSCALLALEESLDDRFRAGAGVCPGNRGSAGGRRNGDRRTVDGGSLNCGNRYGNRTTGSGN